MGSAPASSGSAGARSLVDVLVPALDPGRDERRLVVGGVLPHEVDDVEHVELACGQLLVQVLEIDGRYQTVPPATDDLDRRVDRRRAIVQDRPVLGIGAHLPHRLDEAVPVVGLEIVLAPLVGKSAMSGHVIFATVRLIVGVIGLILVVFGARRRAPSA